MGKTFHQVAADWVVPTARQHKSGQAAFSATWTGIGGGCVTADCSLIDNTLIQAGTEQDVDSHGNASYNAWYELIPGPSIPVSLSINPGDHMRVSIQETIRGSEIWAISIQDLTTAQSFGTTLTYPSSYLTAEWIVETPIVVSSQGFSVGPLPDLGTVNFDLAQTNGAPANLSSSQQIQLVVNRSLVAVPSAPDPDADGLNDCTYASSCPAPATS